MKKRLLALALGLVMMVSLLPVTVLANENPHEEIAKWIVGIENGKTYCGDTYFSFNCPEGDSVYAVGYSDSRYNYFPINPDESGRYKLDAGLGEIEIRYIAVYDGEDLPVTFIITVNAGHTDVNRDHFCDHCGESVHTWQYTTTENSLTATCQSAGCPIGTVGVTLNAHSVTLPDSPFNAQLEFKGDFKEVFYCSEIEYKYEDPGTGWEYVDPDTFTPKPGNYQAGVLITGLPGNGEIAARSLSNDDGAGQGGASVYLFVKYTAVDPKVTAQTGDNRPIEIVMVSVLVFSVLAAAAFILDNKRKYSH